MVHDLEAAIDQQRELKVVRGTSTRSWYAKWCGCVCVCVCGCGCVGVCVLRMDIQKYYWLSLN